MKKIFNKQINISDSCNEIDYIYYNLSSDGSVTQNVDLVKNGVINGLLSDMYISSCYGVEDTGKENLRMSDVKSYDYVFNYFSNSGILVEAIKEYHRTAKIPKGEYTLLDLLK